MTATVAPAAAPSRPPETASISPHLQALWHDGLAWISNSSLRVVLAVAIGTGIVVLLLGVKALGIRLCRSDADGIHWRSVFGRMLAKTKLLFMIALAAELVVGFADAPDVVRSTVRFFWVIGFAIQSALWARELVLGLIEHRAGGDAAETSALGSAMGIIRLLVSFALFAIAAILILDNLGVNVTGLVAGLGIGGIAIGLAAQGIFSDLFAALAILFDRPFRRGDAIKWETTTGTVEAIGLKTTRVRAQTGEEVVISNTNLLNKEIHNMARLDRRRVVLNFGVIYQTPPETCARIPQIVRGVVESCEASKMIRCGMTGFGASSLDFELQFDVHSDSFKVVFDTQSQVCIAILKAFNEAGIAFAYPTQTSYTAAPDGRMIFPYAEPARPDAE